MKANQIMKTDVECLLERDTVAAAARKMREKNVGFLPVCDAGGAPIGVVTDRDLALRVLADELSHRTTVAEIMSREVVSCAPGDELRAIEARMSTQQKSRIMVCGAGGELVGVISLSDIAQHEGTRQAGRVLASVSQREARPG